MASPYETLKEKLQHQQYTWLVTGVAGFIGSNLLEELLHLNQKVIGLDNFSTGSKVNLEKTLASLTTAERANFVFREGDICNPNDCQNVMKQVDLVLHQAALGSVPRSIQYPEPTHATNVTGFLNILNAAKDAKVKRFIYASSSSVYGDAPDLPKKEENIGNPLSPYAVSKYTNELYASVFSKCYGIETIGLRYFNVFGKRQDQHGPYAAVIPLWIEAIMNNKPVYINGDGETTRDFCYVGNAVQANLLAATTTNQAAINTVYNIAVGERNSLMKLYSVLVSLIGKSGQLTHQAFRPGDIRHSLASIEKANRLLGYMPTVRLEEGLRQLVEMHVKTETCNEV